MPYCAVKCTYCQDYSWTLGNRANLDEHVRGLIAEMEHYAPVLGGIRPTSFYFGGGTPSLLEPRHFQRFFRRLHGIFRFESDAQICVEGNPRSFDPDRARALRDGGVNRFSFGVQSLDHRVLQHINRAYQTPAMVATAVEMARAVGDASTSINLDLVAGLPEQTTRSFLDDVAFCAGLDVDLLWLHPFNPEADVFVWTRRQLPRASLRLREEMIHEADAFLLARGFERLFRLPIFHRKLTGHARHFIDADRLAGSVLGLGWGAMSRCDSDIVYGNMDRKRWIEALDRGELPAYFGEPLDPLDPERRFLMFHLIEGIDRELYRDRFGSDVLDDFNDRLHELEALGMVRITNRSVEPCFETWREDLIARRYLLSDRRLSVLRGRYSKSMWRNAGQGVEQQGRTYDDFRWLPPDVRTPQDLRKIPWKPFALTNFGRSA